MRWILIALSLALSISVNAQTEEQQKQQKKVENSKPNQLEVQPSFGYLLGQSIRSIRSYPTYPYFSDYSRRYKSYQSTPIAVSIGASIAVSTQITDPTLFGLYMTLGKKNGLYLHARAPANQIPTNITTTSVD